MECVCEIDSTCGEHVDHMERKEDEEEEEVAIVPPSNTIVHPWTMMIEVIDASERFEIH